MSSPFLFSNLNAYNDVVCYSSSCDKYHIDQCVELSFQILVSELILSIKNLLPDLHIVLISYLSLALKETQNQCLRFASSVRM